MPKLKNISGREVVSFCEKNNFTNKRQKGSHVNVSRIVFGTKQSVTIPDHKEIDRGTLHSIYKKLSAYLPEKDLLEFFYTK